MIRYYTLYIKLNHIKKVLFIETYCTVDWSNISKSLIHLDLWHCRLEQYSSRTTLATESCKDYRGRVGLFFHWEAFDIKWMVWKKMVGANFGEAWWGCKHLALSLLCPATKSSKGYRGWGCALDCRHLALGLHALGVRDKPVCLAADPRKQVCKTTYMGSAEPCAWVQTSTLGFVDPLHWV
jgi:hypothetical protein